MSTLGKILTVLVALVSIAVAVLLSSEVVLREDWKQRYEQQRTLFEKAKEQRDVAVQQRDQKVAEFLANLAHKDQQINSLKTALATREGTVQTLTAERENQETRLQELVEKIAGLNTSLAKEVADRDLWRTERDTAMKQKDDLEMAYTQLEAKYRATLADLQNATENLRQAGERLAAAEGKIAWYEQQPGVKKADQVQPVPTPKMEGLVATADNEARVAEVNLGSDDGVVKGMKFYIFNRDQNKYLATLEINMISNNSAAGELSVIRGDVKVNDYVTNRFE
ncbi:MAG: hypothetical protein ISS74_07195 [Planctomycetes bacterium]|nr:hypothetical protein [Planctomycetota bacterium]